MTEQFTQGDTVYTQDGTQYYFDHAAGEHGYVSPIILIQTTNYHGDDFDEHEEPADHMIPIKLTSLSQTPWVRKIHEETKQAVAERKAILDDLNAQIGAARTEVRVTENNMEKMRDEIEGEARALERRFQWVRDIRRMLGEDESRVLMVLDGVPHESSTDHIELRRDREDKNKWNFVAKYNYDEDEKVQIFANEAALLNGVTRLFSERHETLSVDEQISWQNRWPHLVISMAANEKRDADVAAHRAQKLEYAQTALDKAQAEVEKWQ